MMMGLQPALPSRLVQSGGLCCVARKIQMTIEETWSPHMHSPSAGLTQAQGKAFWRQRESFCGLGIYCKQHNLVLNNFLQSQTQLSSPWDTALRVGHRGYNHSWSPFLFLLNIVRHLLCYHSHIYPQSSGDQPDSPQHTVSSCLDDGSMGCTFCGRWSKIWQVTSLSLLHNPNFTFQHLQK
jgi:hypothetical protein